MHKHNWQFKEEYALLNIILVPILISSNIPRLMRFNAMMLMDNVLAYRYTLRSLQSFQVAAANSDNPAN